MLRTTKFFVLAFCLLGSRVAGAAPDFKPTAKMVTQKYAQAVITVRVVIRLKQTVMGQTRDQEQKLEVGGTVVDPSGLTVTSAFALDPTALFRMLSGGTGNQFRMESEVKETTLILADGTEVEADIVLKDSNLDLAFIKPRESSQPFAFIPLKPLGLRLQILDSVLVVARLGKVGNRALMASVGNINAFVKGPRPFYVCDESLGSAVGNLAYNEKGLPVGIFLTKQTQESMEGGAGLARRRSSDLTMTVLRPIEDLLEIAGQARSLKPAETKMK